MQFSRAQIASDFAVIAAIALLFFIIMFGVFTEKVALARALENRISAQRIADELARAINTVEQGGNGSAAQVVLPESLPTGESYLVSVRGAGRRVELLWALEQPGNRSATASLLTSAVTDINITKGAGSGTTTLNITNSEGLIQLAS